jgi:hypothetical protein
MNRCHKECPRTTAVPIKLLKLRVAAEKQNGNNAQTARVLFALKRDNLWLKKTYRQSYFQVLQKILPDNHFKKKRLENSIGTNAHQKNNKKTAPRAWRRFNISCNSIGRSSPAASAVILEFQRQI